jgi:Xaa-Pro dipeptidase
MQPIGFDKEKFASILNKENVDAVIATKPQNVFYTTGLPSLTNDVIPLWGIVREGFPQFSVITKDQDQTLVASMSAARDARTNSWVSDFRGYASVPEAFTTIENLLKEKNIADGVVAVEKSIPLSNYEQLKKKLPGVEFKIVADELLGEVKVIKSEEEIKRLREASEIGQKALTEAANSARSGVRILDLVKMIKAKIIEEGGTGWYHTNAWCEKKPAEDKGYYSTLVNGDMLSLDIGAVYYGYTSDMRRTVYLGQSLPSSIKKIYDVICQAADMVIDAIKPGVRFGDIYEIAHNFLHKEGYPGKFGWAIGHSTGLEVEEEPKVVQGSLETFKQNMVFCVELWYPIERAPNFGVGLEEAGVIDSKGYKKFTHIDRDIKLVKG